MAADAPLKGAPMRLSSARLALLYAALVTVFTSVLLLSVYLLTRNALEREISAVVRAEVDDLADDLRLGGVAQVAATLRLRADSWGRTGAVFLLADREFRPVAGNLTAWPHEIAARADPPQSAMVQFDIAAHERGESVLHPVEARVERLANGYWLLVGADTSERVAVLRRFGLATGWGIALTALCVWLLGAAYARRTARRVRAYATTCETIMQGDLTQRLALDGSRDEFDALAVAVNAMLDRIEQQTGTLRTAFDSIAHDLRTPLYRLRVRLEEAQLRSGLPKEAYELVAPALEELDRVQRTLATLLQIARTEAGGVTTHGDNVDLAALAANMVELYAPGMRAAGLHVALDAPGAAPLVGNRQLLAQLITNLLENALKYVPAGGHVRVGVRNSPEGVHLSVADDGPGIAAAERAAALRPFVRVGNAAATVSGSGLGLSLAAAVARLHRAQLSLGDNAPGLIVHCQFPATARRDAPDGVAQVS
ncbi:MAG TPA: HAMP domain-containing sensor histidine kinase [Steroidobacteraceae bacterium]|jgi:signal transduction histidine kinase|nr:HAMP domain-containing sensor histidine kinase [Steroidobacteraceae bacterium]